MTSRCHWRSRQRTEGSSDVRWRRRGTLTVAVVAAMTLGACGATQSGQKSASTTSTATVPPTTGTAAATTTTLAPTDATALPGYLAVPTNQVAFIEFTRAGNQISGTVQFAYLSSNGSQMETNSGPIDGRISGSSVTISDENNVITSSGSVSGEFDGSQLVLAFPQQNGQLAQVVFSPASVSDYNKAAAALQDQAEQTAASQQAAATQQAAENKVNADASAVEQDLSNLPSDQLSLSQDVSSLKGDLQTEGSDLKTTQKDDANVEVEAKQYPGGNDGQVCYDASNVAYDASTVSYDSSSVSYDLTAIQDDISTVQGDTFQLQDDFGSLQSDEDAIPSYTPTGLPYAKGVSAAVNNAQASIAQAVSSANQFIVQANGDVAAAYRYAAEASQAGNCGPSSAAPAPISKIS